MIVATYRQLAGISCRLAVARESLYDDDCNERAFSRS